MSKPTDDFDDLFDGIEDKPASASATSAKPATLATPGVAGEKNEEDILAELDYLTAQRPKPASRPGTPRLSESLAKKSLERSRTPAARTSGEGYGGYGLPPSRRGSGDIGMRKTEKSALDPAAATATPEVKTASGDNKADTSGAGGGWGWGSIWSTASAAVKTAEGVVKEIQQSEEGKKWAQQAMGNVDALRGLAGDVRSRALPTFTTLLHTIAPPINSHEQLRIHITHDLTNYPFIDTVVYGVFDRVMQQVEGGDLLVVQRGSGSKPRSSLEGGVFSGGPWWKGMEKRDLNATSGLQEGIKLARVAAESYAQDFLAAETASGERSKDNPTRKSDIFLAIQPLSYSQPSATTVADTSENESPQEPEQEHLIAFAIHLLDPVNNLSLSGLSQALPAQWLEWLDAPVPENIAPGEWALPQVIENIVAAGGVDPRDWVVEWVEEAMGLAIGVVAQRYVAKRMRVGETTDIVKVVRVHHEGGGEEARAVGM